MVGTDNPIVWLNHPGQRLGLVPALGGGVAAWQAETPDGDVDLRRPWDGLSPDRDRLASLAMVPWSNRISGGGFEHAGCFHAITPNRPGEPYPIHGDGGLPPWALVRPTIDTLVMTRESHRVDGNPYDDRATQTVTLCEGGLDQRIDVAHLGGDALPYGLELHPWFRRGAGARLTAAVQGVWLSGADPLPTQHSALFPPTWDLNAGNDVNGGPQIDNAYIGYGGTARIEWPAQGLALAMTVPAVVAAGAASPQASCLQYRPPVGPADCFEPVTHLNGAFHLDGRPGRVVRSHGERLARDLQWRLQLRGD